MKNYRNYNSSRVCHFGDFDTPMAAPLEGLCNAALGISAAEVPVLAAADDDDGEDIEAAGAVDCPSVATAGAVLLMLDEGSSRELLASSAAGAAAPALELGNWSRCVVLLCITGMSVCASILASKLGSADGAASVICSSSWRWRSCTWKDKDGSSKECCC